MQSVLIAQEDIEVIDGKRYQMHYVEKGSTLYSISKLYEANIDQILDANPEMENGLQVDVLIKIPLDLPAKTRARRQADLIQDGFLIHAVVPGETLYGLGKEYGVLVSELLLLNPSAVNGLSKGMPLKIYKLGKDELKTEATKAVVKEKTSRRIESETDGPLLKHEIKEGETLYAISKRYKVGVDELKTLNPVVVKTMTLGSIILIPHQFKEEVNFATLIKSVVKDTGNIIVIDTNLIKSQYNVAVMLPFFLDENDSIEARKKPVDKPEIFRDSEIAIQFYQGLKLAIDSLKRQHISIKLFVYDTNKDTSEIKRILAKEELQSIDLFIGPLYRSNFELVAKFAKVIGASVVSPVPQKNRILLDNAHVSKVSSSMMVQATKMAEHIAQSYRTENILVVNNYGIKDIAMVDLFLEKYNYMKDTSDLDTIRLLKEVYFRNMDKDSIVAELDAGRMNVIVIPSTDQAFVSELMTVLNHLSDTFNITIYGVEKWRGYENIDAEYLHQLNVHITAAQFIDYNSEKTKSYIRRYRSKYGTDPSKYGFSGFDVGYHYLSNIQKYGLGFTNAVDNYKGEGLSMGFDFVRTGVESGCENKFVYILKYHDYRLERVN